MQKLKILAISLLSLQFHLPAPPVAPNVVERNPGSGSFGIVPSDQFILTFDQDVGIDETDPVVAQGNFFDLDANQIVQSFDTDDNGTDILMISGNQAIFSSNALERGTQYAIAFDGGFFTDASKTENVTGFSTTDWTFNTTFHIDTDTLLTGGHSHSLFLYLSGRLFGTGLSDRGQLGAQTSTLDEIELLTGDRFYSVAAGEYHTLILREDGAILSSGQNDFAQLGNGTNVTPSTPIFSQVGTDYDWDIIAAGGSTSYAIKEDGTLWAWGNNEFGECGVDPVTGQPFYEMPTQIGTDSDWDTVSAGVDHALALKEDGSLYVWGSNGFGQLGTNGAVSSVVFSPVLLSGGPWAHISAGGFHNLAITENGELFGWGKNNWFQLGELSGDFISVPTQMSTTNPTGWRDVAAGMDHSLMLKDSGELYGAGRNDHGQRGSDDTPVDGLHPIDTSNTWKAIGSGSHHSIAKDTSGDIYMWGKGHFGALGTGMDLDEIVPTLTKQAP